MIYHIRRICRFNHVEFDKENRLAISFTVLVGNRPTLTNLSLDFQLSQTERRFDIGLVDEIKSKMFDICLVKEGSTSV